MNVPKFKVGEWCFCEFKLQQVQKTEDNRITCVSDGGLMMSGRDLSDICYPLCMKVKQASDTVAYYSKEFHALQFNSLNHPDLNRELISRWAAICDELLSNGDNVKNNGTKAKTLYDSLAAFHRAVVDRVRDLKHESVEGVNLMRR